MDYEVIFGQIVAKANHYQAVPGQGQGRRIIKDKAIRKYEQEFLRQCRVYRNRGIDVQFSLYVKVYYRSNRYDLDNSIKTLLDCLQMAGAITDDNLCYGITAEKHIDPSRPRVEFAIEELHPTLRLFD